MNLSGGVSSGCSSPGLTVVQSLTLWHMVMLLHRPPHQHVYVATRYSACSASKVLAEPRCPLRSALWSFYRTVSWNPPPLGSTNWSWTLCTLYKTGCSPSLQKLKVVSVPKAWEKRSKRVGPSVWHVQYIVTSQVQPQCCLGSLKS